MNQKLNFLSSRLTLGLVITMLGGCAGAAITPQSSEKTAPVRKATTEPAVKEVKAPEKLLLAGKVVETMDAGAYTYILLEKDGQKSWAAMPTTKVEVGQEVEVLPGTQMGKFTSMSLRRTFDDIIFTSGLVKDKKAAAPVPSQATDEINSLPKNHPPMDAKPKSVPEQPVPAAQAPPKGHPDMMAQPNKDVATISGKVAETMEAGGYTYVLLDNSGKKTWVAVPTMKVSLGQELKLQTGAEFTNFKSKTLNRSFDSIIFSAGELPATH